jgi:hypothetical protein
VGHWSVSEKRTRKKKEEEEKTRASLDQVTNSSHLVGQYGSVFEKRTRKKKEEEEKNEVFSRPGGDFVAPGNIA